MRRPAGRTLAAALAVRFAVTLASAGLTSPATSRLAVAFSGGADSTATGLLAAWWAGTARPPASVAAALDAHRRRATADTPRRRGPSLAEAARAALGLAPPLSPPPPAPAPPPSPLPFPSSPLRPAALIVDHGLRGAASSAEARAAARLAARLGLEPVLVAAAWRGEGAPSSTLPARPAPGAPASAPARAARYAALAAAARAARAAAVLTGHTADDQAETVLLRLGRASGVDGLGGMREVSTTLPGEDAAAPGPGLLLVRPLLAAHKADLMRLLMRAGVAWVEDPTNAAPGAGGRNAVRAALGGAPAAAARSGGRAWRARPSPNTAARDARRLARLCGAAREAGEAGAASLLGEAASSGAAGPRPSLSVAPFASAPPPIARRALAALLAAASGSPYPPPAAAVDRLLAALALGRLRGSVSGGRGVVVRPVPGSRGGRMVVGRED